MMKYFFILMLGAFAACNSADTKTTATADGGVNKDSVARAAINDSANYTNIQWVDSVHQELGAVNEGQVADITWKFKNAGTKPLVIANVTAGCGCTVAEKPEEPIAPGAEGVIRAKFNSQGQSAGPHTKSVTVQANTKEQVYYLNFTVNVTAKS